MQETVINWGLCGCCFYAGGAVGLLAGACLRRELAEAWEDSAERRHRLLAQARLAWAKVRSLVRGA